MEQINDFLFCPAFSFFHGPYAVFKVINGSVKVFKVIFYDAQVSEAIHVEGFIVSEKLFEVFFAGGVAGGE